MRYHRPAQEIPTEAVGAATKTTRQVFIGPDDGPNFALRKFSIAPGGEIPMHHNSVEHEQFVLSGSADVMVGDQSFIAQPGDALLIPAGVDHCYRTRGDGAYEFICVIPNQEDVLTLVN